MFTRPPCFAPFGHQFVHVWLLSITFFSQMHCATRLLQLGHGVPTAVYWSKLVHVQKSELLVTKRAQIDGQ